MRAARMPEAPYCFAQRVIRLSCIYEGRIVWRCHNMNVLVAKCGSVLLWCCIGLHIPLGGCRAEQLCVVDTKPLTNGRDGPLPHSDVAGFGRPLDVRIGWVDQWVEFDAAGETWTRDQWRLPIGVIATGQGDGLHRDVNQTLAIWPLWHPREVVEVRPLGAGPGQTLELAPTVEKRDQSDWQHYPPMLRSLTTLNLPEDRFAAMGMTYVTLWEKPQPGVYEIRFRTDANWTLVYRGISAESRWVPFVISGHDTPTESHPTDRVPWRGLFDDDELPDHDDNDSANGRGVPNDDAGG